MRGPGPGPWRQSQASVAVPFGTLPFIAGTSRTPAGRLLDAFLARTRRGEAAAARMHRPSRVAALARVVAATESRSVRLARLERAVAVLADGCPGFARVDAP